MKEIFHVVYGLHSEQCFIFAECDTTNLPVIVDVDGDDFSYAFECCGDWYDLHFVNDEDGISINIYKMYGSEDNMETDTTENGQQTVREYII